ncbi:MAG: hypothetical protein E6K53_01065 [Gammaproteobacteria bacterium]|nr:MAG: hypothetical protein E6K53_01065 [Gammaproteobacteria bacterium]
MLGVPVDRLFRAVEILDHEAVARRHRALAFDEARRHDARREACAGFFFLDVLLQRRVVVGHVADRGHARGEMQATVPGGVVRVHVEQTRQKYAPAGVDDMIGLALLVAGLADRDDAAVLQQHIAAAAKRCALAVEHACIFDQCRAGERMREARLH